MSDSDLIDLIAKNESPTDIHSKIKDILYAKSSDNIDAVKPAVTSSLFGGPNPWIDGEPEETTADAEDSDNSEIEASQEEPTPEDEVDSETPSAELETETETETEEEKPEA
jgi:hypothetical protein|tara:strand:- start:1103 stop:1435 length:333 start_codon:yes stop_codon:yes gene_type:complete